MTLRKFQITISKLQINLKKEIFKYNVKDITSFLGIVILQELISWRFWTGGSLILASAVLINLIKARQEIRIQRTRL